ncbi:MAG: hypothetical protein ACT4UQ_06085 [Gammaproteobacteria bacterium]
MAGRGLEGRVQRNGVVEFDDPDTGRHVVMMEGLTVESGDNDALAVVSVAAVVSCTACRKRWIMPIADYRQGWNSCRHCNVHLYLPALFADGGDGSGGARVLLTPCGHEFPEPEKG